MTLMADDFKNYLAEIVKAFQQEDYRRIINRDLKPRINETEKDEMMNACNLIASVLKGNEEFIGDFHERNRKRGKFKNIDKDELLNRKDAIAYSTLKPSTFDRRVKEEGITEVINGRRRYRVRNLDKLMLSIINSSKTALCIEIYFLFDRYREGYIPFRVGESYPIIEESLNYVYLYNKKYSVSLKIPRFILSSYFRV